MIRLYIFDEGGVMIRNHQIMDQVALSLGLTKERLREVFALDIFLLQRGEIDTATFWERVGSRLGWKPQEDLLATMFKPVRDEPTFQIARELACRFRLVCGTNTIPSHHDINVRLGMYEPFHAVYASHLMHRAKPDPAFWHFILDAEGVPPEECCFVDDDRENVEAASRLGISSVLYHDAASLRAALLETGAPLLQTRNGCCT